MMDKITKTSEEWHREYDKAEVYDSDRWDRTNFRFSWYEEKITFEEFEQRVIASTCIYKPGDKR